MRRRQVKGLRFLRQRPILNYIVDFIQLDSKLIVEIDGMSHNDLNVARKDAIRQKELESLGFRFLRFAEFEASHKIDQVLDTLYLWLDENWR